jgi:hypothetical protein
VTYWWICKYDVYPGVTPIALGWPAVWPPEKDWMESYNPVSSTKRGQAITDLFSTYHWAANNAQEQLHLKNVDFSQKHLWKVVSTPTGETIYVDGVQVGSITYTAAMLAEPNSILTPYGLTFQIQTGDPDNPAADPSVTASAPITLYVYEAAIDVPA